MAAAFDLTPVGCWLCSRHALLQEGRAKLVPDTAGNQYRAFECGQCVVPARAGCRPCKLTQSSASGGLKRHVKQQGSVLLAARGVVKVSRLGMA